MKKRQYTFIELTIVITILYIHCLYNFIHIQAMRVIIVINNKTISPWVFNLTFRFRFLFSKLIQHVSILVLLLCTISKIPITYKQSHPVVNECW